MQLRPHARHPSHQEETVAKDPVCGMDVNEKNAPATSEYKGQSFAFCSLNCKQQFDKNPEQYARKTA